MLKTLVKNEFNDSALICDLIEGISLLGKNFFTKSIGVDPVLLRGFMPLFPLLIKDTKSPEIQIAAVKALGNFISQACVAPVRMINFFKEIQDQGSIEALCQVVSQASSVQQVTPLHMASVHALSITISPFLGDTFSFPWKRNPLEGLQEHTEIVPQLEALKLYILKQLQGFDWVSRLVNCFNAEDLNSQIVTKVAVLRIFIALLRIDAREKEIVAETLIGHQLGKALIKDQAMNSPKDII